MNEKQVTPITNNPLSGTPTFVWTILTVGALIAIQQFVPPTYQIWANFGTVAILLIARYIGVSQTQVFTILTSTGADNNLITLPDAAAAPTPQSPTMTVAANQRKIKRTLW